MCNLCELVKKIDQGEPGEEVLHNDDIFVSVYCRTHSDTPMSILRRHDSMPTPDEALHIGHIMGSHFLGRSPRGTGMIEIKEHWHEHWVVK